jgi:type IV secretion system protein VirB1
MYVIGYKVKKDGESYTLTRQPSTKAEAISWAKNLYANGYIFDAGPTQVRSTNFSHLGVTPETVFDPCTNIGAGGRHLTELYVKATKRYGGPGQTALRAAISAYRTGDFERGIANGGVDKVANTVIEFKQQVPRSNVTISDGGTALYLRQVKPSQ